MNNNNATPPGDGQEGKKPEDDNSKFTPKHKSGELWGVDLAKGNAKNKKAFRKSHYQETIHSILENTRQQGKHNTVTVKEMIPLIQEHFIKNNIKYKANRKSIESALKKMQKDFIFITANPKSVKYDNGFFEVLGFRYMDDTERAIATMREIVKIVTQE